MVFCFSWSSTRLPFLFLICFEVFSQLLHCAVQNNLLKVYCPYGGLDFFLLFYADDYLRMTQATIKDAACLVASIDAYCHHFGQLVNYAKSYIIFSPTTPVFIKSDILSLLHIMEKGMVWQYLGLPLFPSRPLVSEFQPRFSKIHHKIADWKWRHLALAGQVTLLQSMLSSIPLFALLAIHIPLPVPSKMEQEFRAF